jgi:uncharacterized protein YdeI (YjbR/CyaY-like superfamily)
MKTDPRVDAYIERQQDFARPVLEHIREVVRCACPDAEETLKWGMPHFLYNKEILAGMAAFKKHATFGFWRGSLVVGKGTTQASGMGQFGRLTSVDDLPQRAELEAMVRKAMALSDEGVKPLRAKREKPPLSVPEDLRRAIDGNEAAARTFAAFPASCQREYVDWVTEAKREETRSRRISQAVEWMAEGKRRHWKYENC